MSDEQTTEYKLFNERREGMSTLFNRMDEDEKLYFLDPYKMMKLPPYQREEMPGVANITLNDPLIYTQKGIAILGGATRQTVVGGWDLSDKKTTKIEQFLDDIFYMIDEWLLNLGIPGLDAFINEQLGIRGRLAGRVCMRLDPVKGLIPDVLPIDTRYYVDETDGENLVWAARWVTQSKAQIEREYNKPGDRAIPAISGEVEVVDLWNREVNLVFIDKTIVREQPNIYKEVNFVRTVCPSGSTLKSIGAQVHEGESLLWANRGLWEEKNRIVTILQTMTINALFGPLQYPNPEGALAAKTPSPYEPRTVIPIAKDAQFQLIPISDIKAATRLLYSILESSLQRGSFAAIDYGTLTFPLSSLAITRLTASRDDNILPRVNAKALFYQSLSKMIIKQCVQLGETLDLGREGSTNTYTSSDLEGDYTIKYRFYMESQEQMIANASTANAYKGIVSDDTIRREIVKLKDPDGERVKLESEQAEKVDEVLFLFRRAYSLVDKDKPTEQEMMESKILVERARTILKQRRAMGQLSQIEGQRTPETEEKGKELLPLLAGGGQGRPSPEEENDQV